MRKIVTFLAVSVLLQFNLPAQDTILDHYIRTGLESNLALQQKQLNYNKSLASLKEAKGMFFPAVSLNARYTVAYGGRTIDFPVGDLLNPVYSTLNALTANYPPQQQFPDIHVQNQSFYFYRPTDQETKLSLKQPIFSPRITYNYRIRENLADAGETDVNVYKRELVAEIKKGYYHFLQASYVLELLKKTKDVVDENVRVNKSLYRNDKVTIDVVDRSKAEVSKVEQQIADAEKDYKVSVAWFNFLLNRPLETEVIKMEDPHIDFKAVDVDDALSSAAGNRGELKMMNAYMDARENAVKLNKMNKVPELFGAVDYGLQGRYYEISDKADYFLGSLVLKWDLFTGSKNNAKIQKAEIDKRIMEEKKEELEKQIKLEVIRAYYDLEAAKKSVEAAREGRESASSAFRRINEKYKQGQATLIEFMDARNSKTNAEENLIISMAGYLVKYAELERVAGMYDLK